MKPAHLIAALRNWKLTSGCSIFTTSIATDASTGASFSHSAALTVFGGLGMAQALLPRYAQAQTISFTDPRIQRQAS